MKEKYQPKQEQINPSEQSNEKPEKEHKFISSFLKTKAGKAISLFGVSMMFVGMTEGTSWSSEYNSVLTSEGKQRVEEIKKRRGMNMGRARNGAFMENQIKSYEMKDLGDGRTEYRFTTKEGVEIKAIDPGKVGEREVVDGPKPVDSSSWGK